MHTKNCSMEKNLYANPIRGKTLIFKVSRLIIGLLKSNAVKMGAISNSRATSFLSTCTLEAIRLLLFICDRCMVHILQ